MKTCIKKTLIYAGAFALAFGFWGCSEPKDETHTHTYAEEWTSDADSHWHKATCEHTDEVSEKADHEWDKGTITTEATCGADGVKTYTCSVCSATKTEKIDKTGDHVWDEGTVIAAATCTEEGTLKNICTICKEEKTSSIGILAHVWDAGTVTTAATCTKEGSLKNICTACKEEKTTVIKALGHNYSSSDLISDANNHWHKDTCTVCGHIEDNLAQEAHQWNKGVLSETPSLHKTYTCTKCAATKEQAFKEMTFEDFITELGTNVEKITANPSNTPEITKNGTTINVYGIALKTDSDQPSKHFPSTLKEADLTGLDTSKLTVLYSTFSGCENLTSLDLSSFDTSNVTRMVWVFQECRSLTSLDLSNFDTSNVSSMESMFSKCEKLTSLNLSSFNTSKLEISVNMFAECYSLRTLDLSSFDTSGFSTEEDDKYLYNYMFRHTGEVYSITPLIITVKKDKWTLPTEGENNWGSYYTFNVID